MVKSVIGAPLPLKSMLGFEDSLATPRQRGIALAVCATLLLAAACAATFGRSPGPTGKPFIAMAGTIWLLADWLTAFLLLAQFYVSGRVMFAMLAFAYAFSGMMTWPYLIAFPGLFRPDIVSLADEQIPSVVWVIWHCAFPVAVMCAIKNDSMLGRMVSRRKIKAATTFTALAPGLLAIALSLTIYLCRDWLPLLIVHGEFQPGYKHVILPTVVFLNLIACFVLARRRPLTLLSLWLAVATLSTGLDALMVNVSDARYSYAWDFGKVTTVLTASCVLLMMLCEIVGLYGRLARVSRIDVLTSLYNRRAFDEHFDIVYNTARRMHGSVGLLVVDIDHFKRYNDAFGHSAGDECLRRVAREMMTCATRPLDLVGRYGGEEFVVLLPDTPLSGVLVIAERIRSLVDGLQIAHGPKAVGKVTISVGVSFTPDATRIREGAFFDAADRALYEAKARGRNRVVLGDTDVSAAHLSALAAN